MTNQSKFFNEPGAKKKNTPIGVYLSLEVRAIIKQVIKENGMLYY